jgi:LDH2 family malate/lactate/ureidoglycolate dehydrogenase
VKFSYDYITKVSTALLKSLGASNEEAAVVARNLLMADMRGIHTHGINFIPKIADRVENGLLNIPTKLEIISDSGATAHFDGNNGLGQVAAERAMRRALEHAKEQGIGMSLVRNTNHIGLLAFYSIIAAREGAVGFAMCNSAPSMAPWGGSEAFFGTNPFSIAFPVGGQNPVALDMSTSLVARGKIRRALKLKQNIPEGWALDSEGKPTDDPAKAMEGTLIPVGGPKGSGMALFIDVICGMLSGSKYGRDILTFHKPLGPTGVGAMLMAIDIQHFMKEETFHDLARDYVGGIRESRKADGVSRIYLPGEIEAEMEENSMKNGVEIDDITVDEINKLLEKQGIPLRLERDELE